MNAADRAIKAGGDVLLKWHGETLRFRDAAVQATVHRQSSSEVMLRGEYEFTERNASVVEIRTNALRVIPAKGESFQDDSDRYHKIIEVIRSTVFWRCICEISDGP